MHNGGKKDPPASGKRMSNIRKRMTEKVIGLIGNKIIFIRDSIIQFTLQLLINGNHFTDCPVYFFSFDYKNVIVKVMCDFHYESFFPPDTKYK